MVRVEAPHALMAASLLMAACVSAPENKGAWPPEDFVVDVTYSTVREGQTQVRQHARIVADGTVVYREAETSLRSEDGEIEFPVFRKLCAYKMRWKSIRILSRLLHDASVKDLAGPPAPPSAAKESHVVRLVVHSMTVRVEAEARDRAVGLMNRALRIVNSFLPPGHGIKMPQTEGEVLDTRLQDVPAVLDSLEGALGFHRGLLAAENPPPNLWRDTFALACRARNWQVAEECLTRLIAARPAQAAALRQVLATSRAAAPPDATGR